MGQYYVAVILGNKPDNGQPEQVRLCMTSYSYGIGAKLAEHSWIDNPYVEAFESLLTPEGPAHMTRPVWAGDYADPEDPNDDYDNLYTLAKQTTEMDIPLPPVTSTKDYPYIVNHDKKAYVDKRKQRPDQYGYIIHPLPLLIAEGNGRGNGDYEGTNMSMVGIWSRDIISVEKVVPEGYTELEVCFSA